MKTKSKYILIVILILILIVSIAFFPQRNKASQKAISIGKQAVDIADNYLDGELSYLTACDKLDELNQKMDYVDNLKHEDKNKAADFGISGDILILSTEILSDGSANTSDTYKSVIEARNTLASHVKVKKR